jgi:hypothetical protein
MKIGLIGAGQIGGTLTRRFTSLGHQVAVSNSRGPETLADLAAETGAVAVTSAEAVKGRDVVIFTVPMRDVPKLRDSFAGVPPETVVIDTCNYYPRQRDGRIEAIEAGTTEGRWVSQQLGRPTIKAFNNINWTRLLSNARPKGDPARIAIPVSGDDAAAKAKVMALIDELGFDAVDDGGLDDSWRQQPGSLSYGTDLPAEKLRQALANADPRRPDAFTGRPGDPAGR